MYCQHCGNEIAEEVEAVEAEAGAARAEARGIADVADREVEIAKINAKRDVDLAKIGRGLAEVEAVQEAEVATAEAEAVVEVLTPEPEPEPEPVVIVEAEAEAEAEPAGGPPDVGSPPPPDKNSNVWWK